MATFKTYLELCRVSNLPTVWTNVLAAGLLCGAGLTPPLYLLLAVALSCFYMAGMSLNDVCDLDIDRRERPSRPLPSGRMTLPRASTVTVGLFATGLGLLALAPHPRAVAAGLLLLLAIVVYDCRHKQNPWSVLVMAACRFLVFVVTAAALAGQVNAWVLMAGGVQFGYVVLISLVARHENSRGRPFPFPVIPAMLAGISLVDGLLLATVIAIPWLLAGMVGALLTWVAQRLVRGD